MKRATKIVFEYNNPFVFPASREWSRHSMTFFDVGSLVKYMLVQMMFEGILSLSNFVRWVWWALPYNALQVVWFMEELAHWLPLGWRDVEYIENEHINPMIATFLTSISLVNMSNYFLVVWVQGTPETKRPPAAGIWAENRSDQGIFHNFFLICWRLSHFSVR